MRKKVNELTKEDIEQLRIKAQERIDSKMEHYFEPSEESYKYALKGPDGECNYFHYCNKNYWDDKATREDIERILNIDNVTKALMIQSHIESLPYERYHWVIETTPVIDIGYSNPMTETGYNWDKKEVCSEGYLGKVMAYNGDVVKALNSFLGDAEMIIDHANDIAATAF